DAQAPGPAGAGRAALAPVTSPGQPDRAPDVAGVSNRVATRMPSRARGTANQTTPAPAMTTAVMTMSSCSTIAGARARAFARDSAAATPASAAPTSTTNPVSATASGTFVTSCTSAW